MLRLQLLPGRRTVFLGFVTPLAVLIALGAAFYPHEGDNPPIAEAAAAELPNQGPAANQPPQKLDSSGTPREQALHLLGEARKACQLVGDYRCVQALRERVAGELQEEQVMQMDFRAKPFSVRLRWQEPASKVGQQVYYVEGKNNNKMKVRSAGRLVGALGFISISPDDPRVRRNSRHTITEAGLANLVEGFISGWEGRPAQQVDVRLADSSVDGKDCRRVEVVLAGDDESPDWRRGVLHLEQSSRLPLRVEYYNRQEELLEESTFRDLQINVGLGDEHFGR